MEKKSEFSVNEEELNNDQEVEVRFWLGKDYANCYLEDFKNINEFSTG